MKEQTSKLQTSSVTFTNYFYIPLNLASDGRIFSNGVNGNRWKGSPGLLKTSLWVDVVKFCLKVMDGNGGSTGPKTSSVSSSGSTPVAKIIPFCVNLFKVSGFS